MITITLRAPKFFNSPIRNKLKLKKERKRNKNVVAYKAILGTKGWFGLVEFYGISTLVGYSMLNPLYTYKSNIYDLVWFSLVLWYINDCRLFNAKSSLYRN